MKAIAAAAASGNAAAARTAATRLVKDSQTLEDSRPGAERQARGSSRLPDYRGGPIDAAPHPQRELELEAAPPSCRARRRAAPGAGGRGSGRSAGGRAAPPRSAGVWRWWASHASSVSVSRARSCSGSASSGRSRRATSARASSGSWSRITVARCSLQRVAVLRRQRAAVDQPERQPRPAQRPRRVADRHRRTQRRYDAAGLDGPGYRGVRDRDRRGRARSATLPRRRSPASTSTSRRRVIATGDSAAMASTASVRGSGQRASSAACCDRLGIVAIGVEQQRRPVAGAVARARRPRRTASAGNPRPRRRRARRCRRRSPRPGRSPAAPRSPPARPGRRLRARPRGCRSGTPPAAPRAPRPAWNSASPSRRQTSAVSPLGRSPRSTASQERPDRLLDAEPDADPLRAAEHVGVDGVLRPDRGDDPVDQRHELGPDDGNGFGGKRLARPGIGAHCQMLTNSVV